MRLPRRIRAAGISVALVVLVGGCGDEGGDSARPSDSGTASPSESGAAASWTIDHASESRDAQMYDVAAVAADDAWAIGRETTDRSTGDGEAVMLRLSGKSWKRVPVPAQFGDRQTLGMDLEASASGEVWLFGTVSMERNGGYGKTESVVVRWDGTRWRTVPTDFSITDAAVLGPKDVWALEQGDGGDPRPSASHWDGDRWTRTPLPTGAVDLDARAPDDIWAVGSQSVEDPGEGEGAVVPQPAAMRWDGRSWKLTQTPRYRFPSPAPPEESANLQSVVALPGKRDEAWAFGGHSFNHGEGMENEPTAEQFLLRWDGNRWSEEIDLTERPSCCNPARLTAAGSQGFLLGAWWYGSAKGELTKIGKPPALAGRTGETVTKTDRKQRLWLKELSPVPGTDQVIGAGHVELGAYGDANFRRAVVVRYDASEVGG